ncbi:ATP-dependent sacrificial sulfur transferase LarE [Pseudodesulfovibrio sp. zrk46]|uniref:ATP-dependent sacrificial sulfur transferase LarE n=1 Tax=Pseudodesulfovibrio sp. zrk46 TaxID=2725288 RepID=UPI001449899C|nr:ATP-dependent sacrificial sulfur transferase LarE [Pseudodesulfovibrio sp. zrk46]QJB56760.1 ATP-dependent sacrificial sulfur transferase LarE [Pseudodesulfovibrio sp. zrk46]
MLNKKYEKLLGILRETGGVAVAFSGGVDSAFLLYAAQQALGDKVLAVTVTTPYIPQWEIKEAREMAAESGVEHVVIDLPFPVEIRTNPADHCYTCKKLLFTQLWEAARERGYKYLLDGTNVDDLGDYRPGLKALAELDVMSPLKDAGLTKQDIRDLSKLYGLPTWDKPSFACLLSRMPVDEYVTDEALRRTEEAEVLLMHQGFKAVRVRSHGDIARIEIPRDQLHDFVAANEVAGIHARLKDLGYRHVTLDLGGYSMGSQNPESATAEGVNNAE